ncbi:Solute carrier family 35 member G1 [Holothuria leucospilota]|uniref:Solute carrier family 35 member G1 n=1 Tax=Holothuria leucospilota TaxID=206669 RepID=A0A9Q1CRY9_HOLLE|nr:Solute carrier family 35 member G1 [Holothuria leucospilota]
MDTSSPRPASISQVQDYDSNDSNYQVRNTVAKDVKKVDTGKVILANQLEVKENATVEGQITPTQDSQIGTPSCFSRMVIQLRRRHGLVLAAIAPIAFSFQGLLIHVLTKTLDSFQVVFIYSPLFMICCFLLVLYARVRPPKDYRHYLWLLGSGASQSGNACFLTLAFANMSVGNTVTILYTALVQVVFFSRIILKEKMRLFDILFAFVALGGVVFIARPPFIFGTYDHISGNDVTLQGIIFALVGSSTFAIFNVTNRKLSTLGVNSYFCMFSNGTMVVFTSGVITLILQRWRWPTMHEWLFAALVGITYVCAYFTLFYALKVETATLVTVIVTTEIVYAFVLQVVFLHQLPFWTSYIGTVLIIVACIGITLKSKPPPPPPPESPRSNPADLYCTAQQSNI